MKNGRHSSLCLLAQLGKSLNLQLRVESTQSHVHFDRCDCILIFGGTGDLRLALVVQFFVLEALVQPRVSAQVSSHVE
jgi:uncharacterized protein YjlB